MSCIRPATPGFIVTLAATACLAIVSFCVPIIKSIFIIKASVSVDGFQGDVTFGTLGYCLNLANGTTCSKPSVGYQIDLNDLVGVDIPQAVTKWVTYVLVLNIVALALSAASAVFGLLAHVREMSMTCCSTLVSGLAAAVAFIAFVFDLILFFVTKSHISGFGTVSMGTATWLTLAAWVMLFFSGCFFSLGRCCTSRRPRGLEDWGTRDNREEQLRLDAIKAEADRKVLQAKPEGGLPSFHEYQPLAARVDGEAVYLEAYKDNHSATISSAPSSRAGYAPAIEGTRAIDGYYDSTAYPPSQRPPRRQNSATTATASVYSSVPTTVSSPPPRQPQQFQQPLTSSPPPLNQYNNASQYYNDPYSTPTQAYGHGQQVSSYSTVPIHQQQPSAQSNYSQQYNDPYASHHLQHQSSHHTYDASQVQHNPPVRNQASFYTSPISSPEPQRSYTLGGAGYSSPPLPEPHFDHSAPPPINTNVGYSSPLDRSPVKVPRAQPSSSQHEEPPPGYDDGQEHWAE